MLGGCRWSDSLASPKLLAMVTDSTVTLAESTYEKPAYLTKFVMLPFTIGTSKDTVQRIVDDAGTISFGIRWTADARHHYAKDEPWSCGVVPSQAHYFKLDTPTGLLLDGGTFQPIRQLPIGGTYQLYDYRWNGCNPIVGSPDWLVGVAKDSVSFIVTDALGVLQETYSRKDMLTGGCKMQAFGGGEGNLSMYNQSGTGVPGGRWFAWSQIGPAGCKGLGTLNRYIPYLGEPKSQHQSTLSLLTDTTTTIDWASISPSGKYLVVHYATSALQVYDVNQDSTHVTTYGSVTPRHEPQSWPGQIGDTSQGYLYSMGHADMLFNPFDNWEDYICGQEHATPHNHGVNITSTTGEVVNQVGDLICARLRDNHLITLSRPFPAGITEAYIDHVSARAEMRPGWVYVSTFNDVAGRAYYDEIDAYALDGVGHMERIAQMHSNYTSPPICTGNQCYRGEPQPVADTWGKLVAFASNWMNFCGTGCGTRANPQAYVVGPYR